MSCNVDYFHTTGYLFDSSTYAKLKLTLHVSILITFKTEVTDHVQRIKTWFDTVRTKYLKKQKSVGFNLGISIVLESLMCVKIHDCT